MRHFTLPRINRVIALLIGLLVTPQVALAKINIVATTTSMGFLAKEIGGEYASIKTLAAPDRDAHYLQAKPSMMIALRRADLVISVGADLEIGWLPAAINNAANPNILEGQPGYFQASQHLELINPTDADRSKGDVHPEGNPHFHLDPNRMATLAKALAHRMGQLDKTHQQQYHTNSQALIEKLHALTKDLQALAQNSHGALLMHKDGEYLLQLLSAPILGYMEPVPGVPPTANHIKTLADKLKGQKGVIIHAPFHAASGPKTIAKALGWKRIVLPLEPIKDAGFKEYKALLMQWAFALGATHE